MNSNKNNFKNSTFIYFFIYLYVMTVIENVDFDWMKYTIQDQNYSFKHCMFHS